MRRLIRIIVFLVCSPVNVQDICFHRTSETKAPTTRGVRFAKLLRRKAVIVCVCVCVIFAGWAHRQTLAGKRAAQFEEEKAVYIRKNRL
jgi:hypothetical protein